MSKTRCSQCGLTGHNRRNRRLCAVNIANEQIQEQERQHHRAYCWRCVITTFDELSRDFYHYDHSTHPDPPSFVSLTIHKLKSLCEYINRFLECRARLQPYALSPYLSTQIGKLNMILMPTLRFHFMFRIELCQENRTFSISYVNAEDHPLGFTLKRSSEYFKEIYLVCHLTSRDNAVACDCPVCFDSVDAKSVVITSCNHSFCANCINGYSSAIKDNTQIPNCPMCRTDITWLSFGKKQIYNEVRSHLLNL